MKSLLVVIYQNLTKKHRKQKQQKKNPLQINYNTIRMRVLSPEAVLRRREITNKPLPSTLFIIIIGTVESYNFLNYFE